jgi:hypothetical protein
MRSLRASLSRKEAEVSTNDKLQHFTFREVNRDSLKDFVALSESRGGPKSCWCMVWRATAEEARRTDGASRKAAFTRRVKQGTPVGILGYLDDKPIAWCSIAPRTTYRSFQKNRICRSGTRRNAAERDAIGA